LQVPGSTVAYRKYPAVAAPFGLAAPFSVAPLVAVDVAADVVTVGGTGVVKLKTAPTALPTELEARAQK
jgi:hypothetical protein